MRLFDETESRYYELISYLLLQKKDFSGKDVDKLYAELFQGDNDYEILDALFSANEGKETVFSFADGRYSPILDYEFPVRCNRIEQQAFGTLGELKYSDWFITKDTLAKIRKQKESMLLDWSPGDIEVKNQFSDAETLNGNKAETSFDDANHVAENKLRIITEAILQNRAIIYDNVKDGKYEYRDAIAFPVKIEYSFLNDTFRISAFHPSEKRFFMMTLDTMRNVRSGHEHMENIQKEYDAFLGKDRKKVVLDVEPAGHVIERCFRIFSYYERKAVYNREDEKYRLEIMYSSFDEAEVIRNILSLGSSVVVLEPSTLQRKVRDRIIKAADVY